MSFTDFLSLIFLSAAVFAYFPSLMGPWMVIRDIIRFDFLIDLIVIITGSRY